MRVKKRKNEVKKTHEKGITLVALVVTIIILLILAGVSISMVFNSEGLFSKTNDAATRYNVAKNEEANYLTNSMDIMDTYYNKYGESEEKGGVIIINEKEYILDDLVYKLDDDKPYFNFAGWFEQHTGGIAFSSGNANGLDLSIGSREANYSTNPENMINWNTGFIVLENKEDFDGLEITIFFKDDNSLVPIH